MAGLVKGCSTMTRRLLEEIMGRFSGRFSGTQLAFGPKLEATCSSKTRFASCGISTCREIGPGFYPIPQKIDSPKGLRAGQPLQIVSGPVQVGVSRRVGTGRGGGTE